MKDTHSIGRFALPLNELILVSASLVVAIYSVQPFTKIPLGNTAFWWAVQAGLLASLFLGFAKCPKAAIDTKVRTATALYLVWVVIGVVRGAFLSDTYWGWKELIGNAFALFLPFGMVFGLNRERLGVTFVFYLRVVVPLGLVILGAKLGGYGLFVALTPLFILFIPYMRLVGRLMVVLLAISVFFSGDGFRSILIKHVVPFFIIFAYPFASLVPKAAFEFARKTLFLIPLALLALGFAGIFNIFQIGQYFDREITLKRESAVDGTAVDSNVFADSRSEIYREVLETFQEYRCWLAGRTPAHGNETEVFAGLVGTISERGLPERTMNEIGQLNIFMWFGLIGIILQSSIFYIASRHAIAKAPSFFGKAAGLYLAFRWAYGWVEEINNYSLTHLSLWILVGICSSQWITELTDADIRAWITRVFRGQFRISKIQNVY